MADAKYFRVKLPVELTVQAGGANKAKLAAIRAIADIPDQDANVWDVAHIGPVSVSETHDPALETEVAELLKHIHK